MKNQLSPGVAIGAIVAVLAIAGAIYALATRTPEPTNTAPADATKGPPGMPNDVQAEMARRMGGTATGPGVKPGPPGGMPMMPGPGNVPGGNK